MRDWATSHLPLAHLFCNYLPRSHAPAGRNAGCTALRYSKPAEPRQPQQLRDYTKTILLNHKGIISAMECQTQFGTSVKLRLTLRASDVGFWLSNPRLNIVSRLVETLNATSLQGGVDVFKKPETQI